MNLVLLQSADRIDGDRFCVTGARARHIREVLGAAVGDQLQVGLREGPLGTATVRSVSPERVELDVAFGATPPRPTLDVILAVPRPKALRRLLAELAAIGVDRLVLLRSWRVDKSYLTSKVLADPEPHLIDGLMQARCTRVPEVIVADRFRPFVEDVVPERFADGTRLVAHPTATNELATISIPGRVTVAIGPEGGWIPWEVEAFEAAGFTAVSIGPRALRVETATVALLAQIELLRRQNRKP